MSIKDLSRRDFIRSLATGAAAGILLPSVLRPKGAGALAAEAAPAKSRIVIATSDSVKTLAKDALGPKVKEIFDKALLAYTGKEDAKAAWGEIVKPGEKIGLQVNGCHSRAEGPTKLELLNHVIESLVAAGIPGQNLVVIERDSNQLDGNGWFTADYVKTPGVRFWCHTSDGGGEGDYRRSASNFSEKEYPLGTAKTRVAKIFDEIDGYIQFPHLRPHLLGFHFSGAMKLHQGAHMLPEAIHGQWALLADLNKIPVLKDKLRLIVYDGINRSGYNGLFLGKDGLALDNQAWKLLKGKTTGGKSKALRLKAKDPMELWMKPCEKAGLGTLDPALTELIAVKVP